MPLIVRSGGNLAQAPDQHSDGRCDPTRPSMTPASSQQQLYQQQQQQSVGPAVWSVVGRVAGSAWTALQLANRYVLAPAATWLLRNLKAYIEEQFAIRQAMLRPCQVPKYGEDEIRQATDNLGFTHRVLGTPYGMVAYLTRLRGKDVAIRPIQLNKVADAETFWAEAAAGRVLTSGPAHPHIVPYLGCCPALACHVYEQRPYTCSLREALASASPHGAALRGWEARVALSQQLVSAVGHLVRSGAIASDLGAQHISVSLDWAGGPAAASPGSGGTSSSSSSAAGSCGGPRCWLAPGCGFQVPPPPPTGPTAARGRQQSSRDPSGPCTSARPGGHRQDLSSAQQQSHRGRRPEAGAGPEAAAEVPARAPFADMARSLGQVLLQVLCGTDSPAPAPDAVLKALADVDPCRLLSSAVAPPLTADQAWPLLAAIYPLLVWGDETAGHATSGSGAAAATVSGRGGSSSAPGGWWPGAGVSAPPPPPLSASSRQGAAGGSSGSTGRGRAADNAAAEAAQVVALQGHLLRELGPVLAELLRQLRLQGAPPATLAAAPPAAAAASPAGAAAARRAAATMTSPAAAATSAGTSGRGVERAGAGASGPEADAAPAGAGSEEDAFAGASAPPLPLYPPIPPADPLILPPGLAPAASRPGREQHPAWTQPLASPPPPSAQQYPHYESPLARDTMTPTRAEVPGLQGEAPSAAARAAGTQPRSPPEDLLCPITQELMEDPVVAADGHSYERAAIAKWFAGRRQRPTSPLTGAVLANTGLTPNYALRRIIGDWRARHEG